jgi:hypothetical protein
VPVSMKCALKVTRSTTTATRRASEMTRPHSLNLRLEASPTGGPFLALGQNLQQQVGAAASVVLYAGCADVGVPQVWVRW